MMKVEIKMEEQVEGTKWVELKANFKLKVKVNLRPKLEVKFMLEVK